MGYGRPSKNAKKNLFDGIFGYKLATGIHLGYALVKKTTYVLANVILVL
jgi:hypothetical protein